MTPLLAAGAVLLAFAAARELAGAAGEGVADAVRTRWSAIAGTRAGSLTEAATKLRLPQRITRAGLDGRLDPRAVVAAKLGGAAAGAATAVLVVPVVPGRLAIAVAAGLVVAGFLAPDALLERRARRRRDRFVAALPEALDMLAVGSAAGRGVRTVFAEVAAEVDGPLAAELARTVAAIECGAPVRAAIDGLRDRVGGPELGALAAALERSRAFGSPLAEQLHQQATALRRDARRRIEERAARAAPKIQLVVALVLVPSVLLMMLAAIVAHSEELLSGI